MISSISAQYNLEYQYNLAERLFTAGDYYDAITEYKRLIFFDSEKKYSYEANFKIGQSYKAGAKLDESIKYFSIALQNSNERELEFNTKIEIIKVNILRRTTLRAFELLKDLESSFRTTEKRNKITYWKGWTYIFQNEWALASIEFQKLDNCKELINICEFVEGEKYSVLFAKLISYILPGSGQFYTGEYLSGTMSLAWNFLLGYYSINAFVEERVFDGIVISNLLWFRFYRGNYQNAEKFAKNKNNKLYNKQLEYLQKNFIGDKP
ncbi:MAG: hypothetical protein JEY94_03610 [Melioribacteraceae bacterium]|nr:hypothetical protein [Melioribacteraceae bacterium]